MYDAEQRGARAGGAAADAGDGEAEAPPAAEPEAAATAGPRAALRSLAERPGRIAGLAAGAFVLGLLSLLGARLLRGKGPYVDGGAHSLSTSSFSDVICSRAS